MDPASSPPTLPIIGVILAGGLSRRMDGADKALSLLANRPVLAHVVDRLRPQVDGLVINANGAAERFAAFGLPVVADTMPGFAGPLAGFLAGLAWIEAHAPAMAGILTVPCDTPFLPIDLAARLTAASRGGERATFARGAGRAHPVFAFVPRSLGANLTTFLAGESAKVGDWLSHADARGVEFTDAGANFDPFFNINTPEDLEVAETACLALPLHQAEK